MSEFLIWLFEAKLPKKFDMIIDGVSYEVIRTHHVLTPRNGDYKPRDFKMTKEKYIEVLTSAHKKIQDNKPTTITWADGKNNAMVVVLKNNIFNIVSGINNADKDRNKLFDKSPNTIHI